MGGLVRYGGDVSAFLEAAGEYLAEREAEHNLLLGISASLESSPCLFGHDPYLAAVANHGQVVAVALRTPPYNFVLSEVRDPAALDLLAADAADVFPELPGVLGPREATRRFAELWEARTGQNARLGMAQRIFCCERVVPPAPVAGSMRRASAADRPLLVEWMAAFAAEALGDRPGRPAEEAVDDYLSRAGDAGVYLWEDGAAVSLAGCGGPTPNGIRVGPVYTPPDLRGRGYASALVASLTELLLAGARRFCFLFTDLANPTSNRIYERIGYEAVTDVDEYRFES